MNLIFYRRLVVNNWLDGSIIDGGIYSSDIILDILLEREEFFESSFWNRGLLWNVSCNLLLN
jgi:hypothetical protein